MRALGRLRLEPDRSPAEVLAWSAVRGVAGAMAMTGMRRATTRMGLLRTVPPAAIAEEEARGLLARLPAERRELAIELAHWAYGGAAGAGFAALPASLRRRAAAGPLYGVLVWLLFEAVIDPVLGLRWDREPRERAALLADHLLYGAIVGTGPR